MSTIGKVFMKKCQQEASETGFSGNRLPQPGLLGS